MNASMTQMRNLKEEIQDGKHEPLSVKMLQNWVVSVYTVHFCTFAVCSSAQPFQSSVRGAKVQLLMTLAFV